MRTTAILLFLSLLLLPYVSAVGFGDLPSNREVIYRAGEEVRIPFYVINGEHIRVSTASEQVGDPATAGTSDDNNMFSYVMIDDAAPDTGLRRVELVLRFPDHEMRPGTYFIDVYATDYSDIPTSATVAAIATVKFRITVWVLSPDPLVHVLGIHALPIAEGLSTNVTVSYISRSAQDVFVVTSARVLGKDGTTLISAQAPSRLLRSAQTLEDTLVMPAETLAGGEYDVYGTVAYADTQAEGGPVILKIGTLHVAIPEHTQEFTYNTTNRFRFTVTNQWNRELKDVFANARSGRQEKKTASLAIPPFGQTEYEVYFDRDEHLLPGPATIEMLVTFKDYDTLSNSYIDTQESFSLPITIVAPPVIEQPFPLRNALLWGLAIAVMGLFIVVLIMMRRRTPPASPPIPPTPPGGV